MRCPFCQNPPRASPIRAHRDRLGDPPSASMPALQKRFTTFERVIFNMPWVVKKGGGRMEYDRAKLYASIALALRKRRSRPTASTRRWTASSRH